MTIDRDMKAAIAVSRFGLGARPGELDLARTDPEGFLAAQIRREGADQPQADPESSVQRYVQIRDYQMQRREARQEGDPQSASEKSDPVKDAQRMIRQTGAKDFLARAQLGASTPDGFRERWTLFWANHFTVSATKLITATLVGPFEQEAIRPNVFGRFEDLLVASSTHPAMLVYLDQAQSVGPDTRAADFMARRSGKQAGLNENLAREILELHTVGVDAGYTQGDVTEFARALTGYSIGGPRQGEKEGVFVFRDIAHEPGRRTIMGRTYDQEGGRQALAVMKDLAASPHTAGHIARKLAVHFVADDPPPALVERLKGAYLSSNGDLAHVARTLVSAPEAWDPAARKFKTPYEFLISSYRATGAAPQDLREVGPIMTGLGQKPFAAPSPKGWADEASVWCAPDAVVKRMAWSEAFA
ncbi:MAG TPA: DUF1800 family protein, partial [Caulobacteraceae bacterium]|nr:DUF1800 family protein [Caulobacteraceae bacterium]